MEKTFEELKIGLEKLKAEFEESKKALAAKAQEDMAGLFKGYFAKYPQFTSIGWVQYTPYFNDGEACVFRVHSWYDSLIINGEDYGWTTIRNAAGNPAYNTPEYCKAKEPLDEFCELLHLIGEDALESIFGDGVKITVFTDGTTKIDDYDHD